MILFCFFLFFLHRTVSASFGAKLAAISSGCDGYWQPGWGANLCYLFIDDITNNVADWRSSETFCKRQGGHLTSIHSLEQNSYILEQVNLSKWINSSQHWWIGLHGLDSVNEWSDGTPVNFTNFNQAQANPIRNCTGFDSTSGLWSMMSCDDYRPFVCEKEKVTVKSCPYVGNVDVSHLDDIYPSCASEFKPNITLYRQNAAPITLIYPTYLQQVDALRRSMSDQDWETFKSQRFHFFTHGFRDTGTTGWIMDSKTKILNLGPANVFGIDWQNGAKEILYLGPAANTRVVGMLTTKLVDHLIEMGVSASRFWLTGHSLGAHVVGFAGKFSRFTVGRLTGLDPAKPDFDDKPIMYRFNKAFGQKVDVIHTGGNIYDIPIIDDFGTLNEVGDIDFYPNGGHDQPGCSEYENIFKSCSHNRAPSLFVETINSVNCEGGKFNYQTCEEYTSLMGYQWDENSYGKYYLTTNGQGAYCQGAAGVRLVDPTSRKLINVSDSCNSG